MTDPRDAGPIPYSPEWYERRNERARAKRAADRARDPRPGSPEFAALSYSEKARIRGYLQYHAKQDWRALLAALRTCRDALNGAGSYDPDALDALLAKHKGANE